MGGVGVGVGGASRRKVRHAQDQSGAQRECAGKSDWLTCQLEGVQRSSQLSSSLLTLTHHCFHIYLTDSFRGTPNSGARCSEPAAKAAVSH